MQKSLRPVFSLLLGVAFLLAGSGAQFTLLPLRGSSEGFADVALGVIGSAYYVGFVTGCLAGPFAVRRAGHIRAFAAMVAVATALSLAYPLVPHEAAWAVFRFLTGFCLAGLFLVIESWLNDRADNATRGTVMSAYVIVLFGALTLGQMLATVYPVKEAGSFMLAAILCSLAIVPVALTRSAQPAPITIVRFRPGALYKAAPAALVASFMVGVGNGAFWALGPLSAAGAGLNTGEVASFMSLAVLAGALAQWPAGRLSDRIDRRLVLLALLIGAAVAGTLLWLLAASGPMLLAFGFVFGALALPGYSLAAAHGYDKTPADEMVPTAATILLVNGLGAVIGPLAGAAVMAAGDPRALFLFTAGTQVLLAAYLLYRTRVQSSLAPPEKTEFDLATTSPVGVVTAPEPEAQESKTSEPGATAAEPSPEPAPPPVVPDEAMEILPPESPRGR